MDDNQQTEAKENKPKKKLSKGALIGIIVTCSILTAAIAGIVVYLWQNKEKEEAVNNTKSQYDTQVTSLQSEVDDLQSDIEELQGDSTEADTEEDSAETEEEDSEETPQAIILPSALNFFKYGNLLDSGDTFLYEEPGSPAISVTLQYTNTSYCVDGFAICDPTLLAQGQRIFLVGKKSGSTVTVAYMVVQH